MAMTAGRCEIRYTRSVHSARGPFDELSHCVDHCTRDCEPPIFLTTIDNNRPVEWFFDLCWFAPQKEYVICSLKRSQGLSMEWERLSKRNADGEIQNDLLRLNRISVVRDPLHSTLRVSSSCIFFFHKWCSHAQSASSFFSSITIGVSVRVSVPISQIRPAHPST